MSEAKLFDGSSGRLALGSTVIVFCLFYNDACGPAIVFANFLAFTYGAMAAYCKAHLKTLQMPYIRASNKFDYTCLFLATWLDVLAVLCACVALARTMSTCLDAMTGGMAHILILGRNSSPYEPWPDVLGVAVVIIITVMFMLGLDHSNVFHIIMWCGMIILNLCPPAAACWKGDILEWTRYWFRPDDFISLLFPAAQLTFAYPRELPLPNSFLERFKGFGKFFRTHFILCLTIVSLSFLVHHKPVNEYIANPFFNFLDDITLGKLVPAAACLLMLTSSAAYLELFPELYGLIVRFATSEWKVLSKHVSYESSESGSPVFAIFISGSLCAMLAFACPMQHLINTLAASHLAAGFLRALYLLYIPVRPKYIQRSGAISSLAYSRLSTATAATASYKRPDAKKSSKRSILGVNVANITTAKKPAPKKKPKKELEKEWLLLGEPTSPCPTRQPTDVESAMQSSSKPVPLNFIYPEVVEISDSDTSTDIDAIVDEYRQKIRITTSSLIDISSRVPTVISWRFALFIISVVLFGTVSFAFNSMQQNPHGEIIFGCGTMILSSMLSLVPRHKAGVICLNPVFCCCTILTSCVLFGACCYYVWPAIVFWIIAGLMLLLRCDNWCCGCFEHSGGTIQEQLIPSDVPKTMTKSTTIHIPGPPTNPVTVPTLVNTSR
uniref:Cationic amino acid transporter n=1 Tax=Bactrocera dorsalis TaxID=27457 RepID=A0A034W159_BACDO